MNSKVVSVLDEKGVPSIVQRCGIMPPRSSMNAVAEPIILDNVKANPMYNKYSTLKDRDSAFEALQEQREEEEKQEKKEQEQAEKEKAKAEKEAARKKTTKTTRKKSTALEKAVSSAANTIGREIGKKIVRGILGSLKF